MRGDYLQNWWGEMPVFTQPLPNDSMSHLKGVELDFGNVSVGFISDLRQHLMIFLWEKVQQHHASQVMQQASTERQLLIDLSRRSLRDMLGQCRHRQAMQAEGVHGGDFSRVLGAKTVKHCQTQ